MFKRTESLAAIADVFGAIKSSCEQRGRLHLFDNHKIAQHFFCQLLNVAYNLDLVELDNLEDNFPAIDLGDKARRIAYQVTAQKTSEKITKTLSKFAQHQLNAQFDTLKILIIGERQKTYDAVQIPANPHFSRRVVESCLWPEFGTSWDSLGTRLRWRSFAAGQNEHDSTLEAAEFDEIWGAVEPPYALSA